MNPPVNPALSLHSGVFSFSLEDRGEFPATPRISSIMMLNAQTTRTTTGKQDVYSRPRDLSGVEIDC